jgi:hypothetical protein
MPPEVTLILPRRCFRKLLIDAKRGPHERGNRGKKENNQGKEKRWVLSKISKRRINREI